MNTPRPLATLADLGAIAATPLVEWLDDHRLWDGIHVALKVLIVAGCVVALLVGDGSEPAPSVTTTTVPSVVIVR